MNIFEGLLWAVGIIFVIIAFGLIMFWSLKPMIENEDDWGAILSSAKRLCLVVVIGVAFMLDSCDGKFLT